LTVISGRLQSDLTLTCTRAFNFTVFAEIVLTANQCAWCVPPKSISGAVEVALGNAPYSDSDRTCSRVIKRRSRVAVSSMAAPRLKGII